jgi:hypothetical protein
MRSEIEAVPYGGGGRSIFAHASDMAFALQKSAVLCEYEKNRGATPLAVIREHGGRMTNHERTWRQAICVVRDYYLNELQVNRLSRHEIAQAVTEIVQPATMPAPTVSPC